MRKTQANSPLMSALLVCQNTQAQTENTLNLDTMPSVPRGIVAPVDLNAYSNAELVEVAS